LFSYYKWHIKKNQAVIFYRKTNALIYHTWKKYLLMYAAMGIHATIIARKNMEQP
jgi:hypothetical protein